MSQLNELTKELGINQYIFTICCREDWNEPGIMVISASSEKQAWEEYYDKAGCTKEEIEEWESDGEIFIIVTLVPSIV